MSYKHAIVKLSESWFPTFSQPSFQKLDLDDII